MPKWNPDAAIFCVTDAQLMTKPQAWLSLAWARNAAQPYGRPVADVSGASQYDRIWWCLHADMWCHVHTLLTPLLQRGADPRPGRISMEARAMALDVVGAPLELIDLPEPRHLHLLHRQGSRPQSHQIMFNVRGCARVWGSRMR